VPTVDWNALLTLKGERFRRPLSLLRQLRRSPERYPLLRVD